MWSASAVQMSSPKPVVIYKGPAAPGKVQVPVTCPFVLTRATPEAKKRAV